MSGRVTFARGEASSERHSSEEYVSIYRESIVLSLFLMRTTISLVRIPDESPDFGFTGCSLFVHSAHGIGFYDGIMSRPQSLPHSLSAEMLGTMFLVLAVVGSGIMAQLLTTDVALQLLINAAATIAMLYLLINLLAPLSGAHFNPVVTMVQMMKKGISISLGIGYLVSQVSGAILGSLLAHILFDRPIIALSTLDRSGSHLLIAEVVATFGLVVIVFADWKSFKVRQRASLISLWIGSAYFFTSSTSFANPAVTIGRLFTDSFAGISPQSVPAFVAAQVVGALIAWGVLARVRTASIKARVSR
jgi:glycerol uptake facilitator-like aquaporin